MWSEEDEKKKDAIAQRAVGYFQKADRLDSQHPMSLVGKALMFMAKNEDDRAERFLKSVLINHKSNLPAILAKALLMYRRKKFADAKKLYLEAIKLHPKSPQASRMRMCYAYCCHRLGSTDKARAIMKYAASLDETNVDAIIANAIWQLGSLPRDERVKSIRDEGSRFMMMIHHAHAVNKSNPMALNHLANHYFSQWIPLPCTASVVRGSAVVQTSKDISSDVTPGQMICIDDRYVCYISGNPGSVTTSYITLDGPYREESASNLNISRKDYDKMFTLAGNAFHNTKNNEIRSESCYLMGRGCHAQARYKDAYSYYFNAGRLWPNFVLPWFGLAQMYYDRKEFSKAAMYLEKANKSYPENVDVLSLLANVYGKTGKKEEAVILFRRVIELEPGNVDALIGTAELLHESEDKKDQIIAISSYIAAEKVMKNASESIPMELYVNLGALQHRVGKLEEAIYCFETALTLIDQQAHGTADNKGNVSKDHYPTPTQANVTILYNLGRVFEEQGQRQKAIKLYDSILTRFPKYIDCLLRLGCLLRDQGKDTEALAKFDKALEHNPNCAEACLLQGNIHMNKREWSLAQKKFERVMCMPNMKNDPYAFLSMGNIFMSNLGEKNRYTKNMSLAEGYYKKTIQTQNNNMYAANGLGIMVAEKGNFEVAKQIFTQVREASPDMPDAWINLAHLMMAEERFTEAIQLYSVCLNKCYQGRDLQVILYLAKAYYEAKNYPKCISTLSRGVHLQQNDMRLWYNIALAQEDYAVATLGQESGGAGGRSMRTMADVQRAISDLQRAQNIFKFLTKHAQDVATENKKTGNSTTLPYHTEKVVDHEKFCSDTLTKASHHLEFERQREEKRRLEVEEQRRLLREYEERLAQEKEAEKLKEEEDKRRREEVLQKQEQRLKALSEGWLQREKEEDDKKQVKKKSGKKRKKGEEEDFIDNGSGDDDDDGGNNMSIEDMKNRNVKMKKLVEKRQKREREDASDDEGVSGLFGSDSSDEEDADASSKPSSKRARVEEDENEEEKAPAPADAEREAEKNELFGSSSDEE
jgi:RNA polymerase-associated protein CTR9